MAEEVKKSLKEKLQEAAGKVVDKSKETDADGRGYNSASDWRMGIPEFEEFNSPSAGRLQGCLC